MDNLCLFDDSSFEDSKIMSNNDLFQNKKVLVAGTFQNTNLLVNNLKELGADVKKDGTKTLLTQKHHYIVMGDNPSPDTLNRLKKNNHDGFFPCILTEQQVMDIVSGKQTLPFMPKEVEKKVVISIDHYNWDWTSELGIHYEGHIKYEDGKNKISGKELFFGDGFRGRLDCLFQIVGNLGAVGTNVLYPETAIIVISDSTYDKLVKGERDATIQKIENYYNKEVDAKSFDYVFTRESELLDWVKSWCDRFGAPVTRALYDKYMNW